jgi:hypothetical protein
VGLYRLAPGVLDALNIMRPETLLRWHRAGFRVYWRLKPRPLGGRPITPADIRRLISEMSVANPLWDASRIHGELLKLGIDVGQTTVAKYMARRRTPPSQGWKTFLRNHADGIAYIVGCTLSHWQWLIEHYGHERVSAHRSGQFFLLARDQVAPAHIAEFSVNRPNCAPQGTRCYSTPFRLFSGCPFESRAAPPKLALNCLANECDARLTASNRVNRYRRTRRERSNNPFRKFEHAAHLLRDNEVKSLSHWSFHVFCLLTSQSYIL